MHLYYLSTWLWHLEWKIFFCIFVKSSLVSFYELYFVNVWLCISKHHGWLGIMLQMGKICRAWDRWPSLGVTRNLITLIHVCLYLYNLAQLRSAKSREGFDSSWFVVVRVRALHSGLYPLTIGVETLLDSAKPVFANSYSMFFIAFPIWFFEDIPQCNFVFIVNNSWANVWPV